MHAGLKLGLGLGVGTLATGGLVAATRPTSRSDDPNPYPYPGGDTSPGDEPRSMPVRGHIDPPGWFDDYTVDGDLRGTRLDATIDPRGWWNDIHASGRVDHSGFDTRIDNPGWGGTTSVQGTRRGNGFEGSVNRPGFWNGVKHPISETVRGAQVLREGRFEETLTPGFLEASWRSEPVGSGGGSRQLTFDPPGWANDTRVTLEGNPPAGVEATIAAHLFDQWMLEQERQAQYPDPTYPDTTYPDSTYPDPGYPDTGYDQTGPGDDYSPTYPTYPEYPAYPEYPNY